MHISEGVLSAPVLAGGAALAVGGLALGLRGLEAERVPRVAILSSAFFVASLIHVPMGPSSVHLVLNGLVGMVLGWAAFPAIFVGLLLQAVLFRFGGLTTLGVNTVVMASPAVACWALTRRWVGKARGAGAFALGFLAGALAIVGGCLLLGVALMTSGREFTKVAYLVVSAHAPVAVIEGLVTGAVVVFLRQVSPELLRAARDEKGKAVGHA